MENFDTKLFTLTLLNIPRVGKAAVHSILNSISAYSLEEEKILEIFESVKIKRLKTPKLSEIISAKQKAKEILEKSQELNIGIITILDDDFPKSLKNIQSPPVILFYKGNKECLYQEKVVAIIGTRKPTENGVKAAQRLGYLFGEDDFAVVSGLAVGCDENAHRGCLLANGKTIAVLPCGLDSVYPASNKKLAKEILDNGGCLISEYQVGVKPFKNYFIERDRLESALSKAVIVVETSAKSGTMHTVGFSREQSKILAVYKPSEKTRGLDEVQGNLILMEDEATIVLDSPESIVRLKGLVADEKIDEPEVSEQLKLTDFIS